MPPETFLGVEVPDEIKKLWWRWEGAAWRRMRHMDQNNLFPPDQRFSVRRPEGMCPVHSEMWRQWRDHHFDPRSGNRWPGHPGSPFTILGKDAYDSRRCEWDEKCSEQMQLCEDICLSGRSPQCAPRPSPDGEG